MAAQLDPPDRKDLRGLPAQLARPALLDQRPRRLGQQEAQDQPETPDHKDLPAAQDLRVHKEYKDPLALLAHRDLLATLDRLARLATLDRLAQLVILAQPDRQVGLARPEIPVR